MRFRLTKLFLLLVFIVLLGNADLYAQGNKLSISGTAPKNLTVCGNTDTVLITVSNINPSVISSLKITLNLPSGILYVAGSVKGSGIAESNISNLNKPIFSGPNLLIGQSAKLRVTLSAGCDIIAQLGGSYTPQVDIRADYTGNYDLGSSLPFVPIVPSPGFASVSNASYVGNVGNKFVRKVTISNYAKGPLSSMRLMRINGKGISGVAEKGFSNSKNGDTFFTVFSAADFKKIGDKDTLLEQGESVVINDTFTILSCTGLSTYYEIAWGCNGQLCQKIKSNASVTISTDNPVIRTWTSNESNLCFTGTVANKQTLIMTNTGKMPAKNSSIIIYQPYGSSNCRIDTQTLYVKKGWNGPKVRIYADSVGKYTSVVNCMPANSITYVRLKAGEIKVGDTLYVSWDMYRCALTNCNTAFYDLGWIYNYSYFNQCNIKTTAADAWGKTYGYSGGSVSSQVPTDVAANETKNFRFLFNSFSNLVLDKTAQIRIDMVLPVTLTHSLNKSEFFIDNADLSSVWNPDSVVRRGDTLRAFFGSSFKFALLNAELTVKLTGTCAKNSSNTALPVSMSLYYNPQPSCNPNIWIRPVCVNFSTRVHCSKVCNGGMQFRNFRIYRSSTGLPDNDNDGLPDVSGSLDTNRIRTERAMFGDTITTVYEGRPKNASGINSWRYGFAQSVVTYGSYLDVIDAKIVIIKGTKVFSGNCNRVRWKKTVSGVNATFNYDFTVDSIYSGGCLASTYRFTANDSVRLIVRYRVSKNLGGATAPLNFSNRYYLASAANPTTSQSYQCDTFSGSMILYGYYFTNYGPDNILHNDCAERAISQSFYLGIGPCCSNYGGANIFPYEYRNWARAKSMRLHLPSTLKLQRTIFAQYRTAGVGKTSYEWEDSIAARKGSSNPYVFDFDKYYKDSGGAVQLSDDGFNGFFWYTVVPKCNMPAGTPVKINYDYIFERKGALGKGYDTFSSSTTFDQFTFQPPDLKITPALPVVYANSDTVEWIVNYTNSTNGFNAYNIWLSPKKSSNIKVVEVRDLDKDTVIKPINDIYRAGVLGGNKMRRFKIRAVFNSCQPDSLILFGSYNCAEYPIDFASYPCNPYRTALYLEPQNTRLQMTLIDSSSLLDLCATNKITLLLENIQAVTAYNTKVRVSLPIGMSVVPGSATMKYPLNAAAGSIGQPKLISGTVYEWDLPALNSKIASGFKGTTDTAANKLLIVFRVTTNCDYASGSFVAARATANLKCGNAIPVIPAFSNPLDIKGVTRPYYTLVKSWADTLLPCTSPMYVKTRVIFLGPGKSGTQDKIEFFLPEGVNPDTSYWLPVRNAPNKDSIQISNINGAQLVSWKIPANISPGDSMEFIARVNGDGNVLQCGPFDLITRAVVVQPVICVSTGNSCDIKVITGGEMVNPVVNKGIVVFDSAIVFTKLISSDSEMVALSYRIKNAGKSIPVTAPLVVRYHYDNNANGKWDISDDYLASDTFYKNLSANSFFRVNRQIKVNAGQSCAILAVLDSVACSCLFAELAFEAPGLQNASSDTAICSGQQLQIGTFAVKKFSYRWDDDAIVSADTIANPMFTGVNQSGAVETYPLILTTNRGICTSKDTVEVTVYPLPVLLTTFKDTQICYGQSVQFNASVSSGNGGFQYTWTRPLTLNNSSILNPIAKPSDSGFYHLTVADSKGCKTMDSVYVAVNPNPVAWFNWPVTCSGNNPLVVDSSSISSGKIALKMWQTQSFDTFGTDSFVMDMIGLTARKLTLIAKSDAGCSDTVSKLVNVYANPVAAFKADYVCLNDSTRFISGSTIDSGLITAHQWNFGDGNNSNVVHPAHKYASYADFTVSLVVVSEKGCSDTSSNIARVFPNPSAGFTVKDICERDSARFVNTTNLFGDTLFAYKWNFATLGNSNLPSPAVYIPNYGNYSATLTVNTIHGCSDSVILPFLVNPVPKSNFTTANTCLNKTAVFTDSSTVAKGTIKNHAWQFGNGQSASTKDATLDYSTANTYLVKHIVTSDKNCSDSITKPIVIFPLAKPTFAYSDHCFGENLVAVSSIYGGGVPSNYKWYTGSGDSSGNTNLSYTYSAQGVYKIQLTVTTDNGCISDTTATVSVNPLPLLTASSVNPCEDDSVIVTATDAISRGIVAKKYWLFSDGYISAGNKVTRIMSPAAAYSAKFIATSDNGCMDSAATNFTVNPKVRVDFSAPDVCLDEEMQFTNASATTVPISSFAWNLGDGNQSILENPVHIYKKAGTYKVSLSIRTKLGCNYQFSKSVTVHPKPFPGFVANPSIGTIVNPLISVTDNSSGADSLFYRTTDGFMTTQRNFTHNFPDSGTYYIWQIASNKFGCIDSFSNSIYINYMYTLHVPDAFTPNADTKNEVFAPGGIGIVWYSMHIYNRWGEKVYETLDSQPWDGTYKGEKMPEGVYAVRITLKDYKGKKHYYEGAITLLR